MAVIFVLQMKQAAVQTSNQEHSEVITRSELVSEQETSLNLGPSTSTSTPVVIVVERKQDEVL